jgi:hypothetical protein
MSLDIHIDVSNHLTSQAPVCDSKGLENYTEKSKQEEGVGRQRTRLTTGCLGPFVALARAMRR